MKLANQLGMRGLTQRVRASYHIDDLMTKRYTERIPMIFKPALHLYKEKMMKETFSERIFIFVLLEQDKSVTNMAQHMELFDFAASECAKIKNFETISTIFTSAFEIKLSNVSAMRKIADRGF